MTRVGCRNEEAAQDKEAYQLPLSSEVSEVLVSRGSHDEDGIGCCLDLLCLFGS
jgi:hypothetical protein